MLSPIEATALERGQTLKRHVRAAAAMNDLHDDVTIAQQVGVSRAAVSGWWHGAQPSPATIRQIAKATGLYPYFRVIEASHGATEVEIDGHRYVLDAGHVIRVGPTARRKILPGPDGLRLLALSGKPGHAYDPAATA